MKYRVKFQCYWYNTGSADNGHYINYEDFDTLEEAEIFKKRVNEQYNMGNKFSSAYDENLPNPTEYQKIYCITKQEYNRWEESFDFIEIENGFISDEAEIVKYFPATEEKV